MKDTAFSDRAGPITSDRDASAQNEAVQFLDLAARLHGAHGDASAWGAALRACRDRLGCADALDLAPDLRLSHPEDIEALAGRITHCAHYGSGACSEDALNAVRRDRCIALAAHLHEAAIALRRTLQAAMFDLLPPTWILDRQACVLVANAPAKTVITAAAPLAVVDGRLVPGAAGAGEKLRRTLRDLATEVRFAWPSSDGSETAMLLRPLAVNHAVGAILLAGAPSPDQLARQFASALGLTPRQGELAAYLLAGHDLSDAARKMAISRNTANEHLAALLRRTGSADRKALLGLLLRTVRP